MFTSNEISDILNIQYMLEVNIMDYYEKIDWSWQGWKNELLGFVGACCELDMTSYQKQRRAKKIAKARKRKKKRQNRQMANLIIARHCVKRFNNFVFNNNKRK